MTDLSNLFISFHFNFFFPSFLLFFSFFCENVKYCSKRSRCKRNRSQVSSKAINWITQRFIVDRQQSLKTENSHCQMMQKCHDVKCRGSYKIWIGLITSTLFKLWPIFFKFKVDVKLSQLWIFYVHSKRVLKPVDLPKYFKIQWTAWGKFRKKDDVSFIWHAWKDVLVHITCKL